MTTKYHSYHATTTSPQWPPNTISTMQPQHNHIDHQILLVPCNHNITIAHHNRYSISYHATTTTSPHQYCRYHQYHILWPHISTMHDHHHHLHQHQIVSLIDDYMYYHVINHHHNYITNNYTIAATISHHFRQAVNSVTIIIIINRMLISTSPLQTWQCDQHL